MHGSMLHGTYRAALKLSCSALSSAWLYTKVNAKRKDNAPLLGILSVRDGPGWNAVNASEELSPCGPSGALQLQVN